MQNQTKITKNSNTGFTLIEILVVMVIIGVLAGIGLRSFRASQIKSRDARRKSDLDNIARALEMYYNDHQSYPEASDVDGGLITVGGSSVDWGAEFSTDDVVYMVQLPLTSGSEEYCYKSSDGSYYQLFSILENDQDADFHDDEGGSNPLECGGNDYNYGIASSNVLITD